MPDTQKVSRGDIYDNGKAGCKQGAWQFLARKVRDWQKWRDFAELKKLSIFGHAQDCVGWIGDGGTALTPLEGTENLWLLGLCPNK